MRKRFRGHDPEDYKPSADRGVLPDAIGGGADKPEGSVVDKEPQGERPFPDFDHPGVLAGEVSRLRLADPHMRDGDLVLGDEGPIHGKER